MDLHNFSRKTKGHSDPLLIDCHDKDSIGLDSFSNLLGPDDLDDLDNLDTSSDLGHWLQNDSISQLTTALETDGDVSLTQGQLLPVNPESSVMPSQDALQSTLREFETETVSPNSAAMRLHANCSNVEDIKTVIVQQQTQQPQHVQLVTLPVTVNNGNISGNNTPVHSPMKANTIILDGSGTFSVAGTTYIASPQKLQTVSSGSQNSGVRNILTPSQCSPVLLGHLQSGIPTSQRSIAVTVASPLKHTNLFQHTPYHSETRHTVTSKHQHIHRHEKHDNKVYPKPVFSYSCLIALALKNSKTGNLPVSEIYNFMCENFPYFKTAPDGWKNSVRHNLSLNKCFAKVDNPKLSSGAKKGCLWALNPAKVRKMEEEITKWGKKDPVTLLKSMAYPENLEAIESGQAGLPFRKDSDSEDENVPSPLSSSSNKNEIPSTPQNHIDEFIANDYLDSPLQNEDIDQEYVNHAIQWSLQNPDADDIHIDLLTNSPLTSSPIGHGSPLPHTPSRSVSKLGMSPVFINGCSSSPSRLYHNSPSAVRGNLFGLTVTPPRTLSALN